MSDEVKAPREFWLEFQPGSNLAIVAHVGETRLWNGVHVIEHSRVVELEAERDNYKDENDRMARDIMDLIFLKDQLLAQATALAQSIDNYCNAYSVRIDGDYLEGSCEDQFLQVLMLWSKFLSERGGANEPK